MKKAIASALIILALFAPAAFAQDYVPGPEEKVETDTTFSITGKVDKVNANSFFVLSELIAVGSDNEKKLGTIAQDDLVEVDGIIRNNIRIAQHIDTIYKDEAGAGPEERADAQASVTGNPFDHVVTAIRGLVTDLRE